VDTGSTENLLDGRALRNIGTSNVDIWRNPTSIRCQAFDGRIHYLDTVVNLEWGKVKNQGAKTQSDEFYVLDLPEGVDMIIGRPYLKRVILAQRRHKDRSPSRNRGPGDR
jgi:hypothetical protein